MTIRIYLDFHLYLFLNKNKYTVYFIVHVVFIFWGFLMSYIVLFRQFKEGIYINIPKL